MLSKSTTSPIPILLLCGLMGTSVWPNAALGIGLRDDVPNVLSLNSDNPYISYGAEFDSVVNINWSTHRGSYQGSGTLVGSLEPGIFKILTAAHLVDGNSGAGFPDGLIDSSEFTIEFGDNTALASHQVSISREDIAVHPRWAAGDPAGTGLLRGAAQFDLAVLSFTATDLVFGDVSTLPTGYDLWAGDPLGEVATIAGYGRWGEGDSFSNPDGSSIQQKDAIRRAGTNVIDAVDALSDEPNDGFVIRADFDAPPSFFENRSVAQFDGALQTLEASTANGDSGGPLLTSQDLVVGVLHGGYNPFDAADDSEYGDVGVWASVGDSLNRQFLNGTGVAYYDFGVFASQAVMPPVFAAPVPEPSSCQMALVCCLFLMNSGLRKRRQS